MSSTELARRAIWPRIVLALCLALLLPAATVACGPGEEPVDVAGDGQAIDGGVNVVDGGALDQSDVVVIEPEVVADAAVDASPGDGSPMTFVVDTTASSARYIVGEEFFQGALERFSIAAGFQDTIGTTEDVSGQFIVVPGDPPTLAGGRFAVGLNSLTSDQERRDRQVQERIQTMAFPEALFVATAIEGFPVGYEIGTHAVFQLIGDLTVMGTTQPVVFDVEAVYDGVIIDGTATTTLLMSNFGIEPPTFANVFAVEDEITIIVDLVARGGNGS